MRVFATIGLAFAAGIIFVAAVSAWFAPFSSDAEAQDPNVAYIVVFENHDGMVVEWIDADEMETKSVGGEPAVLFYDDARLVGVYFNVASARQDIIPNP